MPQLKPYRTISPHEVISDIFACDTVPATRGTIVKHSVTWDNTDDPVDLGGAVGASFNGTISERWVVPGRVVAAGTGDTLTSIVGMLLYDVKESDENGELLKYNPRKQAEMQVSLSGEATPIMTRGVVLYSGITGAVTAGSALYVDQNGVLNHLQKFTAPKVGKALSDKDSEGYTLVKIEL